MKKIKLKVEGMMCTGCENRIQNILNEIDGVESVKADHQTKTVTIVSKDEVLETNLKEAIEDIGYEIID